MKIEECNVLKTDLYEFSMAAAYFKSGYNPIATFELFLFDLPKNRNFIIAAGLEEAVKFIQNLKFGNKEINYLKSHPFLKGLDNSFFKYLKGLSFSGDIFAVPEGTVVFEKEPIIQVRAPIIEAQILETYLLSVINISSLVATKTARIVYAANSDGKERPVIDFGSRRAHGPEAAILAARSAYIGGAAGTSNVYAGMKYGIPTYGTMAHSFIQSFENEETAFRNFKNTFPGGATFLIDTYDTLKAARIVSKFSNLKSLRIDSGNFEGLSKKVREILDKNGRKNVKIILSGGLNEHKIENLIRKKSAVDIFGVGTELVTSYDSPALNIVYKLVEIETPDGKRLPKLKTSTGKDIFPWRKEILRSLDGKGRFKKDIIEIKGNRYPKNNFKKILEPVIVNGNLAKKMPSLNKIRKFAKNNIEMLDDKYKRLKNPSKYSARVSKSIVKSFDFLKRKPQK